MKATQFSKIFGCGPVGVTISLILLYLTNLLNRHFAIPPITNNRIILNTIFAVICLITVAMIVWSIKSLPAQDRGNKLCTSGAFRYMRHPLYAAFLSVFDFGLAVFLNSWLFIAWAALLHPIWYFLVSYEEKLMIDIFKDEYERYREKTGRFFPKIFASR